MVMLFNAANIEKYQIKKRKQLRAFMIRESIAYIKREVKYQVDHGYDSYSFSVNGLGYNLGFTCKELKEPFYSDILPYFQKRGFKFKEDETLVEGFTMTWSE